MTHPLVNSLFSDMQRIRRELDSYFVAPQPRAALRSTWGAGVPPVAVGETPEDVRLVAFAPGLDEKSIDVSIQGNLLRVAATYEARVEEPGARRVTVHRQERNTGRFSRLVALPESVDPAQVHAWYKDGVLGVVVAKKPEVKPRRIEIATR